MGLLAVVGVVAIVAGLGGLFNIINISLAVAITIIVLGVLLVVFGGGYVRRG